MYRIEFEPGDVGVFRSVEEIATAIKSGVITTRARIYHQATDKWLPIEFHPHYKQALEIVAGGGTAGSSTGATLGPVAAFVTPSGPGPAIQVAPPEPVVDRRPEPVVKRRPEPVAARKPEPEPEPEPLAEAEADDYQPIADRVSGSFAGYAPAPDHENEREPEPETEPAPFAELISLAVPAEPSPEGSQPAFPLSEPRPIVRPRLRMEIAGKPRRSFVVALGGMVLVCTTQLGLTVPERFGLDIRSLGLFQPGAPPAPASAPRSATERAPVNAPAAKSVAAKPVVPTRAAAPAAPALAAAPVPQTSPSFGSSSAFTSAAPAPPPPAKTEAKDSIVGAAPARSEIAIGAPVVPVAVKSPAAGGRVTAAVLVTRYQAAYAAARAELEIGLQTAGFANVFATERLVSPQGVRTARLSAGTASAYVAKYRRREGEIEQAYADSFATMSKLLEWSGDGRRAWENHQVLQEKPEIAKLASFLFAQIDSLYGVLSSQEGAYEITGGTITFQDAKAAHAYTELRPWLDRHAHQWADTASGVPTTAARVLRAIGSTKPPEGGAL